MNEILAIFITWQFVLLCVAISCATFIFRKLIDFFILENPKIPADKHSRVWRELILPFTPIFLGIGFGASPMGMAYPYPEALTTWAGKFLFAASAGMLSPIVYRVITALLRNDIQLPTGGTVMPNVFEGQTQAPPINQPLQAQPINRVPTPVIPNVPPVDPSLLPVDGSNPATTPVAILVPPDSVIETPSK